MKLAKSKLGDYLLPVRNISLGNLPTDIDITYVDISSVDREQRAIIRHQIIPINEAPSRARQEIAKYDVIVSTVRPNLNTVALVTDEYANAIASTGFCVLRAMPEELDAGFLFHWISSEATVNRLMGLATGATYPAVSDKIIKSLPFVAPPILEQQCIATILDKASSLRRKRQEAIRLASELVCSKFLEMFGEPHTNVKGLPKTSLGDLVRLKSGNFLPSHEMAGTGGVFVYGGNGVNGEHDTAMFDDVKLVIGRVGAYCGAVHLTKPHSWITDNALYVSEISPLIRLEYLAFALTQANLNQYSSQSGQPLVSASRLYPVMLVLPPLSLQDAFLEVLERTTRIQASQTNSLEALEEMSHSLAAELFA